MKSKWHVFWWKQFVVCEKLHLHPLSLSLQPEPVCEKSFDIFTFFHPVYSLSCVRSVSWCVSGQVSGFQTRWWRYWLKQRSLICGCWWALPLIKTLLPVYFPPLSPVAYGPGVEALSSVWGFFTETPQLSERRCCGLTCSCGWVCSSCCIL